MVERVKSLLLVEDNDLDAERVERGLRRIGCDIPVLRATNGMDALDRLCADGSDLEQPYVVLLDMNMPKMNGIEFLEELRARPQLLKTPVFVLSTSDRAADIDAAYSLNVSGYIVKPSTREDFIEVLATLVSYWRLCEFAT